MVFSGCCQSNEAVDPLATATTTTTKNRKRFVQQRDSNDDGDDNSILLQPQQAMSKRQSDHAYAYVSNIRLADLESLLSSSSLAQESRAARSRRSSAASSSLLLGRVSLLRHHSYPSVQYYEPEDPDDETEIDEEDEDELEEHEYDGPDDHIAETRGEGDAVFVAENDIPREIGADTSSSVNSTLYFSTPLARKSRLLFLHRLRKRRERPTSYKLPRGPLFMETYHDSFLRNNHSCSSSDSESSSSSHQPSHLDSLPSAVSAQCGESQTRSQSCLLDHGSDDDEEEEDFLLPDPGIPREIGQTSRRSTLLALRRRVQRRPSSLTSPRKFVIQLHAMS